MPWYSAAGRLGVRQRRELSTLLQTGREDFPRILLLHHPPEPSSAKVGVSWRKALADAREMAAAFQQADIILHGHTHRNDARMYGRARVYSTASASAEDASYRLFDLDWDASGAQPGWQVRMTLHQLSNDAVRCVEDRTWVISDA
jgi:3',5'-cyclic AMP phosphodiesterase CpdA